MIIATSYLLYFAAPKSDFRVAATLILIHISSNLALALAPKRIFLWPVFYYTIVPADAGFIALAIWLTRAVETDFYLIFMLVIVLAAIGRNLSYVFLGVTAMCAFYGWLLWSSQIGKHMLYTPGGLLRLPFLVSVAIFIGYLTESVHKGDSRARRLIGEKRLLKRLYRRLKDSEGKFRALAESTTAAIVVCQGNKFIYHNPVAESLVEHGGDAVLRSACEPLSPTGAPASDSHGSARDASQSRRSQLREIRIAGEGREERWFALTAASIRINGQPAIIGTAFEVTEQKRAEERLKHAALHDFVTGLPNRACFMARLERILKRVRHSDRPSCAVLFIDLDRFKFVNDSYGHEAGDRLLFEAGRRLEHCLRPGETVARLGGDEFGVILQGVPSAANALKIAERVGEAMGEAFVIDGEDFVMNASMGLALAGPQYPDADQLLAAADRAMYSAKRQGGARCCEADCAVPEGCAIRLPSADRECEVGGLAAECPAAHWDAAGGDFS